VGIRAKRTDEAEKDWVPVMLDENIRLGRVDENLGPIGYRTLLVWALKEKMGHPGLAESLRERTDKVVDHVAQLATELKAGSLDYGFLYRTTCLKNDIRFIKLDDRINLGSPEMDYSGVEVSFTNTQSGRKEAVTVKGSHITYGLTIPTNAPNRDKAIEMVRYLLAENRDVFDVKGFTFFKPRFYGTREDFKPFESFADYAGEF
jgi:molybdate/tungstate transport system substrate-binding protein